MKRFLVLASVLFVTGLNHAQSSAPFNHYLSLAEAGRVDSRVETFARTCADSEIKPVRKFFYTEDSDWLPAKDLQFAFAGYVTGDANTAEVWQYAGVPRVVYLWEVDMEYQRDTLFCLNKTGDVTKSVSRFFPSQSGEPREHWIYIRTTRPGEHENTWQIVGIYENDRGKRLDSPDMSSEDKDFIKGERVYHYWNDFDFAPLVNQGPGTARAANNTKKSEPANAAP